VLHPTYEISRIWSRPLQGSTFPSSCTVEGVMKLDGPESPHCVYNEAVAVRLAQTIHAPTADGVLAVSHSGPVFVSLAMTARPEQLPNVHWRMRHKVAAKYPDEVAALVAFDIFVGNNDRDGNLKASVANPGLFLFRAFDHSHTLLAARRANAKLSLAALKAGELIVARHPFYGLANLKEVRTWGERIAAIPDTLIAECCVLRRDFRSVPLAMQQRLARALNARKKLLPTMLRDHQLVITTERQKEEG
jgi:hypothetical protein